MTDILSIGASGVRAYQTALGTISENISNANTTGYVRRDATLIESPASSSIILGQLDRRAVGGVQVSGIARMTDVFRSNEVRSSSADVARSESGISWLERVESALDANGLGTKLTGFFNSTTALAADPTSTAARTDFLAQADATAGAFRGTASALNALGTEISAQAGQSVEALNGLSKGLAQLNLALTRASPGTDAAAALMDQRDTILDQMSALTAISVETSASGAATVRLNQAEGPVLVSGTTANQIGTTTNASGSIGYTLDPYGDKPVVVAMTGGALAGVADAAARIADAKAQVSGIAKDFADQVNAVQAAGVDQQGNKGAPLFSYDAADPGATIAITPLAPAGIAAAAAFTAAVGNSNTGTGAVTLAIDPTQKGFAAAAKYNVSVANGKVVITDPATSKLVATLPYVAGKPISGAGFTLTISGTPAAGDMFNVAASAAGSRDNGNLTALTSLRTSGRYEGRLDTLVSSNGSALEARRVLATTQGAIRDNAVSARDSVSGVNLDNEAVELLRFQQAYQASSRVVQVAREIFQSILDVV